LLRELAKSPELKRKSLRKLLRVAWFVPESKALDDLLQEFLHTRNHMAIEVDEYHSVSGVVTIEDVLEEIVGEIIDESDPEEEQHITIFDDGTAEVFGRVHLDEINEALGLNFPEPDDYDTIAGFVISQLDRIPGKGDHVYFEDVKITVLESNRRRIELLRIEKVEAQHREAAAG
jgi:CBS domain containing-hemolysin-like protein